MCYIVLIVYFYRVLKNTQLFLEVFVVISTAFICLNNKSLSVR